MKDKQELIKAIIKYIHKLRGRLPKEAEVEVIVDKFLDAA